MLSIPVTVLLIVYAVVVFVILVSTLVGLSHLIRYGFLGAAPLLTIGIFLLGVVGILLTTWGAVRDVDWSADFEIGLPSFTNISIPTLNVDLPSFTNPVNAGL
ncbi:MAG: hypothetical protein HY341_01765 [Candidatus Kerfeldbacteria bacterium]|nr:hypothetical protein [Candidatus Kerfeldbacteria bacterium]